MRFGWTEGKQARRMGESHCSMEWKEWRGWSRQERKIKSGWQLCSAVMTSWWGVSGRAKWRKSTGTPLTRALGAAGLE